MHARLWIRVAFGWLALQSLQIGVWALFAPRSFYDDFPGFGRSWISVDGPYNEHFVRDFGALNLALAAVVIAAAVTLSRPLVTTAAVASLIWGVPHVTYHLFNSDEPAGFDGFMSVFGLAVFAAIPISILVMSRRTLDKAPESDASTAVGSNA